MKIGLDVLLPHLSGTKVENVELSDLFVRVQAAARQATAVCPRCGHESARVHSRYRRVLTDVAAGGSRVEIRVRVRRFFCDHIDCPALTFVEQVHGLTSRYARRSPLARQMLEAIGLALAGRAGARLATALGAPASRSSLLRIVRAIPDPPRRPIAVLGVDDFATRRGHRYGTVLVDLTSGRPVDLLADREAASLATWLRSRPEVQVVCRDRAGAYADGARIGAPQAIQVADRWHLWHNLAGHVEETVARHRDSLRDVRHDPAPHPDHVPRMLELAAQAESEHFERRALVARVRQRHAAVTAWQEQGKGVRAIMRELDLARETVRRYLRAGSTDELLAKSRDGRGTILTGYKAHLHRRWNEGVTNAGQLFREIAAMGYCGSRATVTEYLQPFRALGIAPSPAPQAPKVRQVTAWLLRRPCDLTDEETATLAAICARCPQLAATAKRVTAFAEIMTNLRGDTLAAWIAAVRADDLPDLRSFAHGLQRDWDAVVNGLTLTHNSGPVDGHVNRIKMLNDRCTAAPTSSYSENASCSPRDRTATVNRDHGQDPDPSLQPTPTVVSRLSL